MPLPRYCLAIAALTLALPFAGCGDQTTRWKPFGGGAGYTYSSLDSGARERSLTPNDLMDASGACPNYVAPAPSADAAPAEAAAPAFGGGVALGMSECDVVTRLGQASAVNFGQAPNGQRSAVLTYNGGPRPGVYRFEAGRLSEMDRVEQAAAPVRSVAKKKPAKSNAPPAGGNS